MLVVLDASVALRVALESEGFSLLNGHQLAAPGILRYEVLSALHAALWRGQVTRELADIASSRLAKAPIEYTTDARVLERAWGVAEERGWAKLYDACYIALAALRHCPLVSADERLLRGVRGAVETLTPAQLVGA